MKSFRIPDGQIDSGSPSLVPPEPYGRIRFGIDRPRCGGPVRGSGRVGSSNAATDAFSPCNVNVFDGDRILRFRSVAFLFFMPANPPLFHVFCFTCESRRLIFYYLNKTSSLDQRTPSVSVELGCGRAISCESCFRRPKKTRSEDGCPRSGVRPFLSTDGLFATQHLQAAQQMRAP